MQKKKKKRLKEFYGLCLGVGGGALRTAYPFCCGSRHHSYQPNGPCWLIRMFHPKWGLIQSTVSPWGREWAVREQILSIIYSDKLSLGRALGVPVEAWYEIPHPTRWVRTQPCRGTELTRNWKTFTRHVASSKSFIKSKPLFSHL